MSAGDSGLKVSLPSIAHWVAIATRPRLRQRINDDLPFNWAKASTSLSKAFTTASFSLAIWSKLLSCRRFAEEARACCEAFSVIMRED